MFQSGAAAPASAAKANPKADEDLQGAAEMGDHEALIKALAEGADVNTKDPKDLAPLHYAAKCGRPSDLSALIKAKANVDITNKGGVTPLIYAASEGWDDCVPLLPALDTQTQQLSLQSTPRWPLHSSLPLSCPLR